MEENTWKKLPKYLANLNGRVDTLLALKVLDDEPIVGVGDLLVLAPSLTAQVESIDHLSFLFFLARAFNWISTDGKVFYTLLANLFLRFHSSRWR